MKLELLKKKRTWAALLSAAALAWGAYSGAEISPDLLDDLAGNLAGIVQSVDGPEQINAPTE